MKKLITLGLSLALAASLTVPALAVEDGIMLISAAPNGGYTRTVTLNGEVLDTSAIPAGNGIPMRLVAENDFGSAYWDQEGALGDFYLDGGTIEVNFNTNEVLFNWEPVDYTFEIIEGVTFLPAELVAQIQGYTVETDEAGNYIITTPNGETMTKLAREIQALLGTNGMKVSAEEMEMYYGIGADNFTEVAAFFPMMTSPDTVVVGKLAEGKAETAAEQFEAFRQTQEDTFSWYLSHNLPKVENAQFVVEGDYFLFVIGGQYADPNDPAAELPENPVTSDDAVEFFKAWVAEQTAAE